jgi:hypothetical protein
MKPSILPGLGFGKACGDGKPLQSRADPKYPET